MKIGIIGSGMVGFAVGKVFQNTFHHQVFFHDISLRRVVELDKAGYNVVRSLPQLIKDTDLSFVCVPTPLSGGHIDLSTIFSVFEQLTSLLENHQEHIVVLKSTVIPGTSEKIYNIINRGYDRPRHFAYNPEFLVEKDAVGSFLHQDRIILACSDDYTRWTLSELYQPFKTPIFFTDYKTAEMVKYASNATLASRISFFNELKILCDKIGVDSNEVARLVAADPRIGWYGTIHGKAWGGSCFPKDTRALLAYARELGIDLRMLRTAIEINDEYGEKNL